MTRSARNHAAFNAVAPTFVAGLTAEEIDEVVLSLRGQYREQGHKIAVLRALQERSRQKRGL